MSRADLKTILLLGFGVAAGQLSLPAQAEEAGGALAASALTQPVQYRGRDVAASRGSLFERPPLGQPGSLFRPRSDRLGPHYEPPPVVYEPPAVTYEPPSVADHTVRGRCAARTRAWYDYCAARFRSFDPNRGTFTTFSGEERPCRCP